MVLVYKMFLITLDRFTAPWKYENSKTQICPEYRTG